MKVEVITVHYNTPDLLLNLYKSVREFLGKTIPFRVIDGSEHPYDQFIKIENKDPHFTFERIGYNIHHGNGMHHAIKTSKADYLLILDSDATVIAPGLLEKMMGLMDDATHSIGRIYKVDIHGENVNTLSDFILYVHPKTILINKKIYFKYKPFKNHGAPCLFAMKDINDKKDFHVIKDFKNLTDYVIEKGRGTVERFGYGLRTKKAIRQDIVFNILVRTSGRPNYYKRCIESIRRQTYSNFKIIVSYDDEQTFDYVKRSHPDFYVKVKRQPIPSPRPLIFDPFVGRRRMLSPYNLYFNKMIGLCQNGYIIFLDDDDMFADSDALFLLYRNIKSENDLVFWRVGFPNNRVLPPDNVFGGRPQPAKLASCGFSFHKKHWLNWDEWTYGDYRIAALLYERIYRKVYINKVLTKLQRSVANGLGQRDDLII